LAAPLDGTGKIKAAVHCIISAKHSIFLPPDNVALLLLEAMPTGNSYRKTGFVGDVAKK
jgi:hypothetical protein